MWTKLKALNIIIFIVTSSREKIAFFSKNLSDFLSLINFDKYFWKITHISRALPNSNPLYDLIRTGPRLWGTPSTENHARSKKILQWFFRKIKNGKEFSSKLLYLAPCPLKNASTIRLNLLWRIALQTYSLPFYIRANLAWFYCTKATRICTYTWEISNCIFRTLYFMINVLLKSTFW